MRGTAVFISSILLGILLALSIYSYCKNSKTTDAKIDFTVKTLFGSAAIISMLVGYQSLRLNIYKDQIKGAFEFLTRFDKTEEREARDCIDLLISRTGDLSTYDDKSIPTKRIEGFQLSLDEKTTKACRNTLSYFEDVALAIRVGYAHEGVIWNSIGPTAVYYLTALRPYISINRKTVEDNIYYKDAERLMKHWREGKRRANGVRPLYASFKPKSLSPAIFK
jgi:hypothetical protein